MVCTVDYAMAVFPGLPFLYCWVLQFLLCWQQPSCNCGPRHLRFMSPSNVAWTEENLAIASNGDAFRGSLLVKRCDHCHGVEGFMRPPTTPNLASLDRLAVWKNYKAFTTASRSHR